MMAPLRVRQIQVTPLAIPLRLRFEHAAASRAVADPVLVRISAGAPYAHLVGYGETLARPYVSGESSASVVTDIQTLFSPRIMLMEAESFAEALEFIDALPTAHEGRIITAARAAVELALIDLAGKVFRRRAADVAGWMELPGFGSPGCINAARYSGIVVGRAEWKLIAMLRGQRWYGLRDFKLKAAVGGWEDRLGRTHRLLGPAIRSGRVTLRVDANAGWSYEQACDALPLLERCGVCAIEQPLKPLDDAILPDIAGRTTCALIADESLVTEEDGRRLIEREAVHVFNVRIAKNGGLMPALRLARMALAAGLDVQLGCLVGETSILSAAGAAFLEACPKVRFVEGAFGRWLSKGDVTRRRVHFGLGGRMRPISGFGLGVDVDDALLQRFAAHPPPA